MVIFEVPKLREVIKLAAPENGLLFKFYGEHLAAASRIFVCKMFDLVAKVATFVMPEEAEAVRVVIWRVCFFFEGELSSVAGVAVKADCSGFDAFWLC